MIWTKVVFEPDFEEVLARMDWDSVSHEEQEKPAKKLVQTKNIVPEDCEADSWEEKHERGLSDHLDIE